MFCLAFLVLTEFRGGGVAGGDSTISDGLSIFPEASCLITLLAVVHFNPPLLRTLNWKFLSNQTVLLCTIHGMCWRSQHFHAVSYWGGRMQPMVRGGSTSFANESTVVRHSERDRSHAVHVYKSWLQPAEAVIVTLGGPCPDVIIVVILIVGILQHSFTHHFSCLYICVKNVSLRSKACLCLYCKCSSHKYIPTYGSSSTMTNLEGYKPIMGSWIIDTGVCFPLLTTVSHQQGFSLF